MNWRVFYIISSTMWTFKSLHRGTSSNKISLILPFFQEFSANVQVRDAKPIKRAGYVCTLARNIGNIEVGERMQ